MKLPTSKSLAQLGLGVATVVIVVMGWTLYSATHSAFEASEQLGRTHDVLRAIDNTDFNFARGESVHRLFLLTGNDAYLNERDAFLSQARRFAMRLAELTADNPTQQGRAQALIPLIDERHRIMDEFVQLRRAAGVEAAGKRMVGIGQTVGNKMHALTEEIAKNEDAQLDERHNESERRHDFTLLVLVSTLILAVVVVTPAYAGFISQARARDRAERLLMEVTAGLPGVVYRLRTSRDGLRHVEYLSEGVEALWGIDRATALGDFKALAHYTIEVDRSRVAAEMEKAERQLGPVQIEFRVDAPRDAENDTLNLALNSTNSRANYLIPGQKNKWIHASAIVSREDDGSIIWNGYWSDITQQKMIDERLIAAEKLLVEVTNGVPGVIAQFRSHRNGEMEFAFLSLGIEPLLGLDRASIMNNFKLAFRQVIPEYLEPLRATFLAAA